MSTPSSNDTRADEPIAFVAATKDVSVRVRGVRSVGRPLRVLIVSATVGAGDAGNARELARRLVEAGQG